MNVKQLIPKGQREIIKRALVSYQKTLGIIIDKHDAEGNKSSNIIADNLNHEHFDTIGLIGMMNYDVEIALPKSDRDGFSFIHGVDFPEYCDVVERNYPTESEWVTLITGDFSFIDDGVHGRECYVNQLTTIEKHLREDVGEVIDCVENDGGGYLVIEDYDGHIEMNFDKNIKKDEREFQVVDVCGSYTVTVSFKEISEDEDERFIDSIDKLDKGSCYERHTNEVYIIRIK